MKNLFTATTFLVFAVLISGVAFLGCEGEEGPTGADGADGADGTASCGSCHNVTTNVLAKQIQWEESGHGSGTAAAYAGGRSSCTMCHSSEGFTDKLAGNEGVNRTDVSPVNCRTCHNIHKNYDSTDYALSTTDPVDLIGIMYTEGNTIDIGKGNLCANCHQTRARTYGLEVDGADVKISSSHWGAHYGTQSNYLTANSGFEVPGTLTYASSYHSTGVEDGCVTCHMYNENHTFEVSEDACATCHADIDGIDEYRGVQDEFAALITELETLLLADSLLAGDPGDTHPNSGVTRSANKAGALLNFRGMVSDGSLGIHNTKYQRALLQNSIEVFK